MHTQSKALFHSLTVLAVNDIKNIKHLLTEQKQNQPKVSKSLYETTLFFPLEGSCWFISDVHLLRDSGMLQNNPLLKAHPLELHSVAVYDC